MQTRAQLVQWRQKEILVNNKSGRDESCYPHPTPPDSFVMCTGNWFNCKWRQISISVSINNYILLILTPAVDVCLLDKDIFSSMRHCRSARTHWVFFLYTAFFSFTFVEQKGMDLAGQKGWVSPWKPEPEGLAISWVMGSSRLPWLGIGHCTQPWK